MGKLGQKHAFALAAEEANKAARLSLSKKVATKKSSKKK